MWALNPEWYVTKGFNHFSSTAKTIKWDDSFCQPWMYGMAKACLCMTIILQLAIEKNLTFCSSQMLFWFIKSGFPTAIFKDHKDEDNREILSVTDDHSYLICNCLNVLDRNISLLALDKRKFMKYTNEKIDSKKILVISMEILMRVKGNNISLTQLIV